MLFILKQTVCQRKRKRKGMGETENGREIRSKRRETE